MAKPSFGACFDNEIRKSNSRWNLHAENATLDHRENQIAITYKDSHSDRKLAGRMAELHFTHKAQHNIDTLDSRSDLRPLHQQCTRKPGHDQKANRIDALHPHRIVLLGHLHGPDLSHKTRAHT